jgi:RHS repeat-associated protein
MSWLAQVVYYGGQQTLTLPPNEGSGGAALVAVPAAGTAASPDVTGENLVDPSPSMDYAVLFRRGGGLETFNSPESETPSVGIYSQSVLKALPPQSGGVAGSAGFLRTFPDGSTETYTTPGTSLATTSGIGPWLLTSIADPQGNAVTVHYDSQYRITSLVDAINESTAFQYNWPGDALKVSAIVDPFGRTASFTYDSMGRLASITDVLGIKSTYAYDSTDVDFVTALTTPYGPTQFSSATAPPPTDCGPPFVTSCTCAQTDKWVQATDPLGRTSRVESCDQAPGIPDTDTVVINGIAQTGSYIFPANMSLYGLDGDLGALLQFRNTFVWNPAQYDAAFSATGMDYTKAKIVHWLHTPDFTTTSRVPESTKEPLDNRIWYTYPGQTSALGSSIVLGTSNRPTGIGRVLPNGSTELWSYGYGSACNGYPYNQLCTVTDPVGRQLNYQYDPNNNIDLLSITAAGPSSSQALLLTTFGSYVAHRPGTFAGPSGEVTSYQYNGQGQLTQVTPPDPPDYGFTYDGKGNLTIVSNTSPLLPSTAYTLSPDSNNRLQTLTDSVGNSVTFSYDDADRVTRETFADGTTNQFSYTLLDLTDTTDRTGHSTTRLYSPDRELWQIDQAGRQTNLAYYPDGRLLAVSDPRGAQTLFGRDLEGRLTNTYYPGPPAQSYSWDTVGRLVSDPTATYAYNADETLQSITYPSGDYTTMLYDPVFRRLSSVNQYIGGLNNLASQVFYQYYATAAVPAAGSPPTVILGANRLESVTTYYENVANEAAPIFSDSVMYSYDSNDREASETISPENASLYGQSLQYDELGRIVQVTSFDNFLYGYSDNTARVTSVSTGLGPQASLSYYGATTSGEGTGDGLLQQLAYVSQTDSPLASWSYEYNANHQVTSLVDTTEPENLSSAQVTSSSPSYDPWGELVLNVVVQGNTTWNNAYQYDSSGNLNVAATEYQGDDYTATAANEISPDVFNTVYDANGNATTLGSTTYTWGDANRLASVTTGSQTSAFTYDAFGHLIRVVDSTGGTVTADHLYFWCGSRICLAHDNTQATEPVTKVYYDQGFVVPSGGSAQPYYYLKDALGSVRQVWTPQAQVGLTSYDPYGNVSQSRQASGAPASDIGYAGYFAHAGLDLAEHRAYTPTYARWLNRDPIGFAGGLNLYTYADNDPLSRSDPSGNCPWCIGAAAGFVAGGALGYYTSGGSWTATAEGAAAGALAGATGAFLGVLAGGGTLADALGVADLASVAIPGAAALQSQGENCGASIKNGEFREGAFSSWDPSIPQTGQYLNVGTDVTASQFQATLEANGFSIAQEGLSSNGPFAILTNGQTTYTIYTATSTGEASVQVFNSAGQTVLKYRLGL